MQVYFGRRCEAPAFDDATKIPTPVGESCLWCGEPIAEGDSGTTMGCVDARIRPVHFECYLRATLHPFTT